jgi:hypothetical protein
MLLCTDEHKLNRGAEVQPAHHRITLGQDAGRSTDRDETGRTLSYPGPRCSWEHPLSGDERRRYAPRSQEVKADIPCCSGAGQRGFDPRQLRRTKRAFLPPLAIRNEA